MWLAKNGLSPDPRTVPDHYYRWFPNMPDLAGRDPASRVARRVRDLAAEEKVLLVPRARPGRKEFSAKRVSSVRLLHRPVFGEEVFADVERILPYVQLESQSPVGQDQTSKTGTKTTKKEHRQVAPLISVPLHVERFFGGGGSTRPGSATSGWTYVDLKTFAEQYFLPARERLLKAGGSTTVPLLVENTVPLGQAEESGGEDSTLGMEEEELAAMERVFGFLVGGTHGVSLSFPSSTPLKVWGEQERTVAYAPSTAYIQPTTRLREAFLPEVSSVFPDISGALQNIEKIFATSFRTRLNDSELDAAIGHKLEGSDVSPVRINTSITNILDVLIEQCFPVNGLDENAKIRAAQLARILRSERYQKSPDCVKVFKTLIERGRNSDCLVDADVGAHKLLNAVACVPVTRVSSSNVDSADGHENDHTKEEGLPFLLVNPSQCSLHQADFSPLLHRIPDAMRSYAAGLTKIFGISDTLTAAKLQALLRTLPRDRPVDAATEKAAVIRILQEWGRRWRAEENERGQGHLRGHDEKNSEQPAAPESNAVGAPSSSAGAAAAPPHSEEFGFPLVLCQDLTLRSVGEAFVPDGSSKSAAACPPGKQPLHREFSVEDANRFGVQFLSDMLDLKAEIEMDDPSAGDPADLAHQDFGQRVELVDVIRRTIDDYNDTHLTKLGLATILRESLANFDDNQASEVHLIYDTRDHESAGRLDSSDVVVGSPAAALGPSSGGGMNLLNHSEKKRENLHDRAAPAETPPPPTENSLFSGPSLLIAGDSVFQDQHFRGIQSFARSNKQHRFDSDGRFGVGTATYFGLCDQLELLSNERFCALDPCRMGVVRRRGGGGQPGATYSEQNVQQHWPAQLVPFNSLPEDVPRGTIFRLPLRKRGSTLKSRPVERDALEFEMLNVGAEPWAHLFDRYMVVVVRFTEQRENFISRSTSSS